MMTISMGWRHFFWVYCFRNDRQDSDFTLCMWTAESNLCFVNLHLIYNNLTTFLLLQFCFIDSNCTFSLIYLI
jgi:hypothetical protein